ncbi:hypothetical protein JOM56_011989 [Amanita muscaria]
MSRSLKSVKEELVQLRQYEAALEAQRKEEEAMARVIAEMEQEDERKRQAAKEEARPEQASSNGEEESLCDVTVASVVGASVSGRKAGRQLPDADIAEQTPKQKKKVGKATKKKTVGSPASDDILERLVRALSQNTSVLVDIAGTLGTQAEIVEDIAVTHRAMQLLLARDPRTSEKVESGEEDAWVKDMMEVDEEEEYVARKGRDVVEDGIGVDGEVRKRKMATDSSDDE